VTCCHPGRGLHIGERPADGGLPSGAPALPGPMATLPRRQARLTGEPQHFLNFSPALAGEPVGYKKRRDYVQRRRAPGNLKPRQRKTACLTPLPDFT
jgi:hypothetical protein